MAHQEAPFSKQEHEASALTVAHIQFEYARETLGIGTARPRLSWRVETSLSNWHQAAYELEALDPAGLVSGQSGRIASDLSRFVPWPFPALTSRQRLQVRLRVWGSDGSVSRWSEPAQLEAGLLHPEDWSADFVTPDWEEDRTQAQPAPFLRREFEVHKDLISARLYSTALGVYEAQINGAVVGDHVLAPGWTSYDARLLYQTFDVTALLQKGRNALGAIVGDGWYRGRLGFGGGKRNIYGDELGLLAQLELTYADGHSERIVTDQNWHAARGPIISSDIYDGETYDARLELPGWSSPGYDDHNWAGVRVLKRDLSTLAAQSAPPVRRMEVLAPVAILTSPSGRTIVDFGQNLVGRLRLTVRGTAGQTLTLRHAEVLERGEMGIRPLRTALAIDRYILRGGQDETWEPRFTFHGFRYAEIEGWPGELHADDVRAVICHSDLERTGWFECSDSLLNRFHENVVWSMRGNFFSIPTDCPQRDERMGWTGDIQVFAPTASFLYDTTGFLASWLADVAADQTESGSVPFVVPNVLGRISQVHGGSALPTAAWGDAAVLVPWTLYQRYGDSDILATQFASMRGWVDLLASIGGESLLWNRGFQFGDWLDPSAPPDKPGQARTDPYVIATAYFARSAEVVGRAAEVLERKEDAAHYLALSSRVRDAFGAEYVTPAGRVMSDAATAYSLALQFDLLKSPEQRRHAGERLVELVSEGGFHINTGFVGTPLICDALASVGAYDIAFRLLMQQECPSWLYPVTMGATTIWERWDSMLPDGSINPGQMTSFNHYALGAVADWLHRAVAGLVPAEPGYRRLTIEPHPGGHLTSARASLRTSYGLAGSAWALEDGMLTLKVIIPPNTTASVILPGAAKEAVEVGSGTYSWSYAYPIS